MNNTEKRLFDTVNAYIGIEPSMSFKGEHISKEELDQYFANILTIFENELQEIDTYEVRHALYDFWNVDYPKLVPMPVNKKAQEEYNRRFGK